MNKDAAQKYGITKFDASEHLRDDEEARLYLMACVDEAGDDAAFIAKALGKIAKSRVAMAEVAKKTGLSRESLYKALSGDRDPSFSTIIKVSAALGLRLSFSSADETAEVRHITTATMATKTRNLVYLTKRPRATFSQGVSAPHEWEEWSALIDTSYQATVITRTTPRNFEGIDLWPMKSADEATEASGKSSPAYFIDDFSSELNTH